MAACQRLGLLFGHLGRQRDVTTLQNHFLAFRREHVAQELLNGGRQRLAGLFVDVDVEHAASFANYNMRSLANERYKNKIKSLLHSSDCKRILAWTNACKISIKNTFGKEIDEKTEVVYPAIRSFDFKQSKDTDKTRILVSSRFFVEKGGLLGCAGFGGLGGYGDGLR